MKQFEGHTVLVVGASSGIGKAIAGKLAAEGACIVGVGREEHKLNDAMNELNGSEHKAIIADVSDRDQTKQLTSIGKEAGGYIGGVFCAGIHEIRPISVLRPSDVARSIEQNLTTALNCTRALARASRKDGAGIVWLSSVAALRGTAGFAAYAAAKGGLISAMRVAAVELANKKIRVNVIAAGVVETPMSEGWLSNLSVEQRTEIDRSHLLGVGKPEDVAGAAAFLLSDDARWITGSTLVVDGGLSAK